MTLVLLELDGLAAGQASGAPTTNASLMMLLGVGHILRAFVVMLGR